MTFKEFVRWCSARAADGCWSFGTAVYCLEVIDDVRSVPFWRRKKKWREYEQTVVDNVVEPINRRIREVMEATTDDQ